jgi:hypothetical protein
MNKVMCGRIYIHSIEREDLSVIIEFSFEMMFSLLMILTLISQFATVDSQLFCRRCSKDNINISSSIVISETDCLPNSISYAICFARLTVNHQWREVDVFLDGSDGLYSVLNQRKMVKNQINIQVSDNRTDRILAVYCANNQSCFDDIDSIYSQGKLYK